MARVEVLPPSAELGVVDALQLLELPAPAAAAGASASALRSFVVSSDPKVVVIPNFLGPSECAHLRDLADGHWTRSLVGALRPGGAAAAPPPEAPAAAASAEAAKGAAPAPGPTTNGVYATEATTRTSSSCMLRPAQTAAVERLEKRLSLLAGLPAEHLERLVVVRYAPGEQFSEHHDGKFRPRTIFVYLNDLPEGDGGGDTFFPHLGLSFVPRAGCAVMWPNATADGREDSRLVHAGRPPRSGVKYGVNCFFNDEPMRLLDRPSTMAAPESAFVVDVRGLLEGASAEGPIRTFNFETTPAVTAVPALVAEDDVETILALLGAADGDADGADAEVGAEEGRRRLPRLLRPGDSPAVGRMESRVAAASRFPLQHLAPPRIAASSSDLGACNRCVGQRAGLVCLAERDEVFFPFLGLRCSLRRGDALFWPNAIRSAPAGGDGYGGSAAKGQRRVVEDLRTTRVHLAPERTDDGPAAGAGAGAGLALELSFHDVAVR